MKKLAITMAVLAATGATYAQAENKSAATTITTNVEEICNIGMWATGGDGYVGDSVSDDLGTTQTYFSSELNDFNLDGQSITGKVKCNASGGYSVDVVATNGVMSNNDGLATKTVEYTVTGVSGTNFTLDGGLSGGADLSAGTLTPVGGGSGVDTATFKIKMTPDDTFSYAGVYSETLTFHLNAL